MSFILHILYIRILYTESCPLPVQDSPFGLIAASYQHSSGTLTGWGRLQTYLHTNVRQHKEQSFSENELQGTCLDLWHHHLEESEFLVQWSLRQASHIPAQKGLKDFKSVIYGSRSHADRVLEECCTSLWYVSMSSDISQLSTRYYYIVHV